MRSRWLSTFSILGILLIALGIVGKIIGPKFIFDPGQIPDGNEAWYYMIVGVLMLLNGLISPALTAEEKKEAARTDAATVRKPEVRAAVTTTAEKRGDNA